MPEADGPTSGWAPAPAGTPRGAPPVRLVVTGESTAAGVGVGVHADGMAGRLALLLAAETARDVQWRTGGRNGARAGADPWGRLGAEPHGAAADVVVIVLGVNDTLALTSVPTWRRHIRRIVEEARSRLLPDGIVVLAGVPRIDAFPALPQPMRALLGAHAAALDAALADIASPWPDVVHVPTPPMSDDLDLATDRFHPSGQGYTRWAAHLHDCALRQWASAVTAE